MSNAASRVPAFVDHTASTQSFLDDVVNGLQQPQKKLPCKYFYDERGSRLFDRICELPEYYLTRTEMTILEASIDEIVAFAGSRCLLIEYGSGSSLKTRILLDNLSDPVGYVPVDISREHLRRAALQLAEIYPELYVLPVCADYTAEFDLPFVDQARPVVFFPGSTIGNFTPEEACAFLRRVAGIVGSGGGLLIGVDLQKDPAVIERAYNDAQGVTAAFNENVLLRINRELGANIDTKRFAHHAFYNARAGRVEMHLRSLEDQLVRIGKVLIPFRRDETILTEYSYKYRLEDFAALAGVAGFDVEQVWTDEQAWFSVQALVAR